MGNLNLAKKKRTKGGSRGASGIPNWVLTTVISVVVAAMLLGASWMAIDSLGVMGRLLGAASTPNYKITQNMMRYFTVNTFQNYLQQDYARYLSCYGVAAAPGDLEALDNVIIGAAEATKTYDSVYASTHVGKSWRSFFVDTAKDSVKSMLIYCEAAKEYDDITLDEQDKKDIEAAIDASIEESKVYGFTTEGGALKYLYGEGIKREDIRAAMELSIIASKCQERVYEDVVKAVTDDVAKSEYDKDTKKFNNVDYFKYSLGITRTDVATLLYGPKPTLDDTKNGEIDKKLVELQAKVKEDIDRLAKITDLAAFKTEAYKVELDHRYDIEFAELGLAADKRPTDADLAKIKEIMIADLLAEIANAETEATDDAGFISEKVTASDGAVNYFIGKMESIEANKGKETDRISVREDFAKSIKEMKSGLFSNLVYIRDNSETERANYKAPTGEGEEQVKDAFSEWAYAEGRKDGDMTVIRTPAEDAKDDDGNPVVINEDTTSVSYTVYMLTKAQYKDETVSKDISYLYFTDKTKADKALAALKALGTPMTKDNFDKVAEDESYAIEGHNHVENYVKGNLGAEAADEWLAKDTIKKGDFDLVEISTSSTSSSTSTTKEYLIIAYIDDGDPYWMVDAKNAKIEEDAVARDEALEKKYESVIKFDDKVLANIGK